MRPDLKRSAVAKAKTAWPKPRSRRQEPPEPGWPRWKCGSPGRWSCVRRRDPDRKLPPITVNVVLVREAKPPPGEAPVEWLLVTTLPIGTPEQAWTIVEYYCVRWCIEVFFRTLKTGCRIEERRFEDIERVYSCLALYLIVAWRTSLFCHLGRENPYIDCEAVIEPSEWKAVWVAMKRQPLPEQKCRACRRWCIWWPVWAAKSRGVRVNRERRPSGSACNACTTWPGPGTRSAQERKSATVDLWGTTRAKPWVSHGPPRLDPERGVHGGTLRPCSAPSRNTPACQIPLAPAPFPDCPLNPDADVVL